MGTPNLSAPQPAGPDVMVSYSSQDRTQVMQFVQKLRSAGVPVWIDFGGIDGAQRWGEEIVNAIEACKIVLLMVSRTSMQSTNIAKEVSLASDGHKHFLPLYLEPATIPRSMQYPLAGIQHIKLYEGDPERNFVAVLRALVRLGVRVSPYYIALVSADIGDKEQAFEWLNRALDGRSAGLRRLKTEGRFDMLRNDPRFAAIVARAETLTLEPEYVPGEMPVLIPKPKPQFKPPAGPEPFWKKLAWPEIWDDRSARWAASQGVWACVIALVATVAGLIAISISGEIHIPNFGWSSLIVFILILTPIAFGIQKMGRPAGIIGLILCGLSLLGDFNLLTVASAQVEGYSRIPEFYRANYPSPYPLFAYACYATLVGLVCLLGYINATRGTLAYRQLVVSGQAEDKQDAIKKGDWSAGKPTAAASGTITTSPSPPQQPAADMVTPPPGPVAPQARPQPRPPAPRLDFAELIGSGSSFDISRAAIFLLACVLGRVVFLSMSVYTIRTEYWLFAACQASVFAVAAVLSFRILRVRILASLLTALLTAVGSLPLHGLLWTFVFADVMYREQFQQFILLPFVHGLILALALAFLAKPLRPLVLPLCISAFAADVLTLATAGFLRSLGSGQPPDVVLAEFSISAALARAVVFAVILWGGTKLLAAKSVAPQPQ